MKTKTDIVSVKIASSSILAERGGRGPNLSGKRRNLNLRECVNGERREGRERRGEGGYVTKYDEDEDLNLDAPLTLCRCAGISSTPLIRECMGGFGSVPVVATSAYTATPSPLGLC